MGACTAAITEGEYSAGLELYSRLWLGQRGQNVIQHLLGGRLVPVARRGDLIPAATGLGEVVVEPAMRLSGAETRRTPSTWRYGLPQQANGARWLRLPISLLAYGKVVVTAT